MKEKKEQPNTFEGKLLLAAPAVVDGVKRKPVQDLYDVESKSQKKALFLAVRDPILFSNNNHLLKKEVKFSVIKDDVSLVLNTKIKDEERLTEWKKICQYLNKQEASIFFTSVEMLLKDFHVFF